jgi:hypothetical protein
MSAKRAVIAALVACPALVIASCGSTGPRLTSPGANSVGEGQPRVHFGDTVTIGSMVACLDRAGTVTVTDMTAVNPIGLKVTGWGLRPNPFWQGAPPSPPNLTNIGGQITVVHATLSRLGFTADHHIDATCGKRGEGYEFAVQVQKTTAGEAGASGWVVTYKTGDETRKLGFALAVVLCNEKVSWSKRCNALKV